MDIKETTRDKGHEVDFHSDVQKLRLWVDAIELLCEKIKYELDQGVIRSGGKIPERRKGDRRNGNNMD